MKLEALSEKPCYLLSGGEKKRLAIAGVLAMRPEIILFDEPFSHLDYPGIQEVLRHMVHLHREGHTLVVTTHDVEKVIAHVDRMAIIHEGELKGWVLRRNSWQNFRFRRSASLLCHFWKRKGLMAQRIAFHYFPGDSLLHRWDARCKFLGLLMITATLIQIRMEWLIFDSVLFLGLFVLSRFPSDRFFVTFGAG